MKKRKLNPLIVILLSAFCAVVLTVLILHFIVGYRYVSEKVGDTEIKFIGMTKGGVPESGKLYKSSSQGSDKGKLDGKASTITWNSGEKYKGERKGLIYHGKGVLTLKDGTVIDGTFVDGQLSGTATITYPSGNVYEGEVLNFNLHGFGAYSWSDGTVYVGSFSDNQKNGYGYSRFADGSVYIGEYKNSVKDGKGVFYFKNEDIYVGDFAADKRTGKGIYVFANSEETETEFDELFNSIEFTKEYANLFFKYFENEFPVHFTSVEKEFSPELYFWQKFEQILVSPVEAYIGDFSENLFEGHGRYIWLLGREYTGEFSQGTMVEETAPDTVQ